MASFHCDHATDTAFAKASTDPQPTNVMNISQCWSPVSSCYHPAQSPLLSETAWFPGSQDVTLLGLPAPSALPPTSYLQGLLLMSQPAQHRGSQGSTYHPLVSSLPTLCHCWCQHLHADYTFWWPCFYLCKMQKWNLFSQILWFFMNESFLDYIQSSTCIYFHLGKTDSDRLPAFKQSSFVHQSYTVLSYFHIILFPETLRLHLTFRITTGLT